MRQGKRRQQILQTFLTILENSPGARVTTAALAHQVGVSEAALYRHFPSKAKMLEGLIESMETSLFCRVDRILAEETVACSRCNQILWLVLSFVEKNPGFSRLFVGDVLQGETDRLRYRMRKFFDRLESKILQIIGEDDSGRGGPAPVSPAAAANLMLAAAVGRINQFVRSEFKSLPTTDWEEQWAMLESAIFDQTVT
jgi:TetR/AcrR family transcriptional regulator